MTRILLADDHPMIRTAIEVLLRDTDFEIVGTAATGEDALSEIERLEPDILLLDLQMPGGTRDGRPSRAAPRRHRPLKIVLLTAAIDDRVADRGARRSACRAWCSRIRTPAYLLDCLEQVQPRRHLDRSGACERAATNSTETLAASAPAGAGAARTPADRLRPQGPAQPRDRRAARSHRGHGEGLSPRGVRKARRRATAPSSRSAPTSSSPSYRS